MNDDCRRFLEEPEANRAHADQCHVCRVLFEELSRTASLERKSLIDEVDELPVAPWEGARYRPWSVLAAVTLTLAVATLIAFATSGSSLIAYIRSLFAPARIDVVNVGFSFSELISRAPAGFHVAVIVGFVAVNALLFFLLRRPTRGYDATK